MARLRSDDRRNAVVDAATRCIASHGLGASTASIAQAAGVSTGSLFTYFPTKTALLNHLYVDLKTALATALLDAAHEGNDARGQMAALWAAWLDWAIANPDSRRALAQLAVSDEITAESRDAGHRAMARIAALLERSRGNGPMADLPLGFVSTVLNAIAEATVEYIAGDPAGADAHREASFAAVWRMLGGR